MKTFSQCCNQVAKKYGLGTTLKKTHEKYWAEAAKMYAREALEEAKKFSDYGEEIDKIELK